MSGRYARAARRRLGSLIPAGLRTAGDRLLGIVRARPPYDEQENGDRRTDRYKASDAWGESTQETSSEARFR